MSKLMLLQNCLLKIQSVASLIILIKIKIKTRSRSRSRQDQDTKCISLYSRTHMAPRDQKFWIINLMTKLNKVYDTTPCLDPSIQGLYPSSQVYLTAYISLNSQPILVKVWILNLMIKPNKPYHTTTHLDPSIKGLYPSSQVYLTAY